MRKYSWRQEIVARFTLLGPPATRWPRSRHAFAITRYPKNMPAVTLHAGGQALPIPQLCKQAGLTASTSEALRLIEQRGLKIDGDVVTDKTLSIAAGKTVVVQAGKRKFARVTVA
jgi:tyrosyl-tRNA synthetase